MTEVLQLLWHVPTVMAVMLVAGLMMGQRHVGELSVFDLLTGIAIGAVAGAGIVDPDLPHLPVLLSILGLALLHYGVTWAIMKWRPFGRLGTFEPLVVVRHGRPLRAPMQRVRLSLADLLPLLREKDVFDVRDVEYAVLEPDGKVTVLKAANPHRPAGLTRAVVVDGVVDQEVLRGLHWDEERLLAELRRRGHAGPGEVYLATLDEAGDLFVVPMDMAEQGPAMRH